MKNILRIAVALLAIAAMLLCSCNATGDNGDVTTTETPDVTTTSGDNGNVTTAGSNQNTTTAPNGKLTYKVTVKDADGNAIEGANVQLCEAKEGGSCFMPIATGADGSMTRSLKEGSYYASFPGGVEGFKTADEAGSPLKFYFEAGSTELVIVLEKAS